MTNFHHRVIKISDIERMEIIMCNGMQTVRQFALENNCDYAVNCGMWSWSNSKGRNVPVYTLKAQGVEYTRDSLHDGLAITNKRMSIANYLKTSCDNFVSGVPVICVDFQDKITQGIINMHSSISGARARTIVGFDGANVHLFAVEETGGIAMKNLYSFMYGLGIPNAINLDGGGSTQLVENGKLVNKVYSERPVLSVLAIWLKKEKNMGRITKIRFNDQYTLEPNITVNGNKKIAPNFKLSELYDPTTGDYILDVPLLSMLQKLRTETGWTIFVSSCYRGASYNKMVGGSTTSKHLTGQAVDFKAEKNGKQISVVHVAYALQDLLDRFNIAGGIGVYMPNYLAGSQGFNHFDSRTDKRALWVCYKNPTLISISNLDEISI